MTFILPPAGKHAPWLRILDDIMNDDRSGTGDGDGDGEASSLTEFTQARRKEKKPRKTTKSG